MLPEKPIIQEKILHSDKHTNPDKFQALYYSHILPYDENKYIQGKYYYQELENGVLSHIARIESVNKFNFNSIPNTVALIVAGVNKAVLQSHLLALYGPEIKDKELGFYVFLNWDKFYYREFICKPFGTDAK